MSTCKPHLYFNSDIDSADAWHQALLACLPDLTFTVGPACTEPETVDVALLWQLPPQGLSPFRHLRAIQTLSAGINQLNGSSIPTHIAVARLVDASLTQTMVEYAKAAVYRYHRNFDYFVRQQQIKQWQFVMPKLARQRTVGILGLGVIGQAIADHLAADGFNVIGWSRQPKMSSAYTSVSGSAGLASLLEQVDILLNVLPLTEQTRHLLSAPLFAKLAKPIYLINMGRGAHLNEADLLKALNSGQIIAATLDVTVTEPLPPEHPFWQHPDILLTPHIAGVTLPQMAAPMVAENIKRAMAGQPLLNQVDFKRGY